MVREPVTTSPDVTLGEFMDEIVWTTAATRPTRSRRTAARSGSSRFAASPRCRAAEWDTRRVRDCMLPREAVAGRPDDELIDAASSSAAEPALVLEGEASTSRADVGALVIDGARAIVERLARGLGRRIGAKALRFDSGPAGDLALGNGTGPSGPSLLGWPTGLEPATAGTTTRGSTN